MKKLISLLLVVTISITSLVCAFSSSYSAKEEVELLQGNIEDTLQEQGKIDAELEDTDEIKVLDLIEESNKKINSIRPVKKSGFNWSNDWWKVVAGLLGTAVVIAGSVCLSKYIISRIRQKNPQKELDDEEKIKKYLKEEKKELKSNKSKEKKSATKNKVIELTKIKNNNVNTNNDSDDGVINVTSFYEIDDPNKEVEIEISNKKTAEASNSRESQLEDLSKVLEKSQEIKGIEKQLKKTKPKNIAKRKYLDAKLKEVYQEKREILERNENLVEMIRLGIKPGETTTKNIKTTINGKVFDPIDGKIDTNLKGVKLIKEDQNGNEALYIEYSNEKVKVKMNLDNGEVKEYPIIDKYKNMTLEQIKKVTEKLDDKKTPKVSIEDNIEALDAKGELAQQQTYDKVLKENILLKLNTTEEQLKEIEDQGSMEATIKWDLISRLKGEDIIISEDVKKLVDSQKKEIKEASKKIHGILNENKDIDAFGERITKKDIEDSLSVIKDNHISSADIKGLANRLYEQNNKGYLEYKNEFDEFGEDIKKGFTYTNDEEIDGRIAALESESLPGVDMDGRVILGKI